MSDHPDGGADLSERIRLNMATFSPAERRVARVLLAGPPTVGLESSARLAKQAQVSGPTVVRFANRLGFSTYTSFQDALRDELDARVMSPVSIFHAHGPTSSADEATIATRAALALPDAVRRTFEDLPQAEFSAACRLIGVEASRVMIFGGWFSHVHARYAVALLQEIRPNVRFLDDSTGQRVAALVDAKRSDTAVVFDFRRYEESTVQFTRALHESGSKVVLVTDRWLSPIAEFADIVLPTVVEGSSPFDTLMPAFGLVEAITTGVVALLGEPGTKRFEKFNQVSGGLVNHWGVVRR